ncbi:hypothetical protein WN55_01002 [Dufourea novaeangliae]|uniref:Uncharacterized protein n=1 Tax=Dufourea novaeangliae TaxID=178035 RepID=A0A154PDJ0_DUFNO|nr:hypothetical protein WN55_01002 [Dufourea novaeangliae]
MPLIFVSGAQVLGVSRPRSHAGSYPERDSEFLTIVGRFNESRVSQRIHSTGLKCLDLLEGLREKSKEGVQRS